MPYIYAIVSVLLVSAVSLIGIAAIPVDKLFRKSLIYIISFSAGALLGDVFVHLLPEVVEEAGFELEISAYILTGIMTTFIVEKWVHWHHHHREDCKGDHHDNPIAFMTLFGDSVHNFIDGLIIGASYLISTPVGIATTIAVVLHEIPQEIGNYGVLLHSGYSRVRALMLNLATALTALIGTIIALALGSQTEGAVIGLSAFAAGNFIYIAAADLIPELHHHKSTQSGVGQFIAMLAGILVMAALLMLE